MKSMLQCSKEYSSIVSQATELLLRQEPDSLPETDQMFQAWFWRGLVRCYPIMSLFFCLIYFVNQNLAQFPHKSRNKLRE
jgi:hypothetical protein